jgi:hypothetical protein
MTPSPNRTLPALVSSASRTVKILTVLLVIGLTGGVAALAAPAKPGGPPTTPPPKPVIDGTPANPTNVRSATFSFSDARSGVTFLCRRDGAAFSACSSPRTFTGPLAQGAHTFAVKAVDAGGQSAPATFAWRVDLTPPRAPVITSAPSRPTVETSATFGFATSETGAPLRCQLDNRAAAPCTSGVSYNGLAIGPHVFAVRALDAAGNRSGTTTFSWTILSPVHGFTVAGSLADPLHPGASSELNVRITNPYNFAIEVTGLTVVPKAETTRDGQPNPDCDGTVNLITERQFSGPSIVVPKQSTRSLSDLAIPQSQWPELLMPNLSTNQDACKGTSFTFAFSASATREGQ